MFADDVREGLCARPKRLSPVYFYDALGSALFDAICRLPEYKITRSELALLDAHAAALVSALPDPAGLIELGCGNGEKIGRLVAALVAAGRTVDVDLVDVSEAALRETQRLLQRWPGVGVRAHRMLFEPGLRQALARRGRRGAVMILFLGSNIGNFDPPAAGKFLTGLRETLRAGDRLLLGVDLVKPEGELLAAYDDPLGVTAAFNKNLLARINRELGGDFDLAAFEHRALWNARESRVEMHLIARRAQRVSIPGAGCTVDFEAGEGIWTENSYKYRPERIVGLAEANGFRCRSQLLDAVGGFSLNSLLA